MRLLQALAYAKRLDGAGSAKRGAIVRQVGAERQVVAFDLTAIRNGQEPEPEVLLDDVILIDGCNGDRELSKNSKLNSFFGFFRSLISNK
jgi:polysaccharide biosynthesis/export protein